jgi:hypothetical protein
MILPDLIVTSPEISSNPNTCSSRIGSSKKTFGNCKDFLSKNVLRVVNLDFTIQFVLTGWECIADKV